MDEKVTTPFETKNHPHPRHHFVLIHGLSHGAWCWYKIKCLLENSGHTVSCLDLRGCGLDHTDANTILSFEDYNRPLIDFLSALPPDEKVILVGHSAGGLSVTDAIHKFGAKKIMVAVYIAATMLSTGFTTHQDVKDGSPDLSELGESRDICDFGFGLGPGKPPTSVLIKKTFHRRLLYHMSPQEDSTLASMLLRPGPVQALKSARFIHGGGNNNNFKNAEEVGRVYIKTACDRVVKPEQQEVMINKWPPEKVYVVESDHSPFFSAPFLLAGLLVEAASLGVPHDQTCELLCPSRM